MGHWRAWSFFNQWSRAKTAKTHPTGYDTLHISKCNDVKLLTEVFRHVVSFFCSKPALSIIKIVDVMEGSIQTVYITSGGVKPKRIMYTFNRLIDDSDVHDNDVKNN